jgi:acetylornithine/succinyldiaminopimelate/putrescine aminotransferase
VVSHAFLNNLCLTSDAPIGIEVERAEGVYIYGTDGRQYLDLTAGIGVANIGHGRREVAAAVADQLARHAHVMVYGEYEQRVQTELAHEVVSALPSGLDRIFLTCTGTEAIEGALKTARKFTGRAGFAAFEGSYHGDTMGAMSVQASATYRKPYEPLIGPVQFLPYDDPDALDRIDHSTAGVVLEPVQGEGGIRVPSAEFLRALRERTRAVGALLIYDEVLTGFGRTGQMFAMEHAEVTPDIVCLAKAMGGGLPLGGFAGRDDIMQALASDPPLSHVSTFGGHPASCAAGLASLRILREEALPERALTVGAKFRAGLDAIVEDAVGGVVEARGVGLMLGLRFAEAAHTRRFVDRSTERGLLLGWTLHCDDIIRITPPLTFDDAHVEAALDTMRDALT